MKKIKSKKKQNKYKQVKYTKKLTSGKKREEIYANNNTKEKHTEAEEVQKNSEKN